MRLRLRPSFKQISENHGVYLLRAGFKYAYFEHFEYSSRVFFNIPDITLSKDFQLDDELKKELQKAKALGDWIAAPGNFQRPSSNTEDYDPTTGEINADHGARGRTALDALTFSAIEGFYKNVRAGDLVVVPGPGGISSRVLIGEIEEEYDGQTTTIVNTEFGGEHKYPALKVKWLSTNVLRKDFSIKAYKAFGYNRVWHQLARSVRIEIYDHAYGEYSVGEASAINVRIDEPNAEIGNDWDVDSLSALEIQQLILYFSGAYEAIKAGAMEDFAQLSLYDALATNYVRGHPLVWESTVHSPGLMTFRDASDTLKCFFIAVMLGVGAHAGAADGNPHDIEVHVVPWDTIPEQCAPELEQKVSDYLRLINVDVWMKNCQIQKEAQGRISGSPTSEMGVEQLDEPANAQLVQNDP
ncbi:hypothetical protein R0135_03330 [Congregibacter variabilis]|uniref:Uncharacterized protein n=1 Tax=Congregibacter variabilis TaxID=3081200 RepID=A0ABZ0I3W6_9GAMM|nr:hypothetical protein R0135_03330 [Congregibacter sp. IMCC43200]